MYNQFVEEMEEVKFSVLVPAYKGKYLRECIDSVLSQTYNNFELIIVNDASPEQLKSIVKSFNDNRIHYYENKQNTGALDVVDNWNKCLSYAEGDYVICMGDDDRLSPNCLEEYSKIIKKYPGLGVYHAGTQIIDENSRPITFTEKRPEYESVYSLIWHRMRGRTQFIGDFLYDTKKLKANGGFYKLPLAWGSDDVTAYIAAKDRGIANVDAPIFQYRSNRQTISNTGHIEEKLIAHKQYKTWLRDFLSVTPADENDRLYRDNILSHDMDMFFLIRQDEELFQYAQSHSLMALVKLDRKRSEYDLRKGRIMGVACSVLGNRIKSFVKTIIKR